GHDHSCGIRNSGELYCWGCNDYCENGYCGSTLVPVRVLTGTGNDTGSTSVSAGPGGACGIRAGELWCWGHQQGNGLGPSSNLMPPTRIGTDSDWVQVAKGANVTCGIRASGKLYCTTAETNYQFRQQGTRSDWQSITAGSYMACGLAGGEVHCQGDYNQWGQ